MEPATERVPRIIWKNGSFLPETEATVSIYDSALMFGDMVFEMTRSFNGKHFRLKEHLERLYRSADHLSIDIPYTVQELSEICTALSGRNKFEPDDEHRLMINVSRGALGIYKDTGAHMGTNIVISDFPLRWTVRGMGKLFDTGVNAVIPSQRTIPFSLIEPMVKHRSRLHFMMANIEVSKVKGDNNWALMLDPDGYITEGTGANFFISKGIMVATPKLNVLLGISRKFVSEIAKYWYETNITPFDVANADEAFFTGTPFCIMPVTSINGKKIGNGQVGKNTKDLLDRWGKMVGVDIAGQVKAWDTGVVSGPSPYQFKGATL